MNSTMLALEYQAHHTDTSAHQFNNKHYQYRQVSVLYSTIVPRPLSC